MSKTKMCKVCGEPENDMCRANSESLLSPATWFGRVYDILVEIGGARPQDKDYFVIIHTTKEPCDEYRFQGKLGFGGKYRRKRNRVDCYLEDETPERMALIARINAKLAKLPNR